jgi:thymidylate synthase ThyX
MQAQLVYDGSGTPTIPVAMGTPKAGQFEGTPRELTAELCGRVCYDSLGKGRNSNLYHEHIHEVGHLSVYEHTPFTVVFNPRPEDFLYFCLAFVNRPGVWVKWSKGDEIRVTINFRAVLDWDRVTNNVNPAGQSLEQKIGNALKKQANDVAPRCVPVVPSQQVGCQAVVPEDNNEKWVTLFMSGSRGFSHEQVRHGDSTAISQRSTRYVDEDGTPWVYHPLIAAYLSDPEVSAEDKNALQKLCDDTVAFCGNSYVGIVPILQEYVKARNEDIDNLSARKQARGAARGFLGNALLTEMLFSASVKQWRWMLHERASQWADAEIREIYARESESVMAALMQSQYADDFRDLRIAPSPDGIGTIVEGWSDR